LVAKKDEEILLHSDPDLGTSPHISYTQRHGKTSEAITRKQNHHGGKQVHPSTR